MPRFERGRESIPALNNGPYEAIVLSHLDPKFMGGLQVELLKTSMSGNLPERTGQTFTVKYMPPFYGVTPSGTTNKNSGYEHSQKSYGMWMIPPDVGTKVLVIFVEGNPGSGFWIGCIPDEYMNFMLPGNPSTAFTESDTPATLAGKKLPAVEYNKATVTGSSRRPTTFTKPYHKEATRRLIQEGLLDDETRGTTTSSARREVPSAVFGISTPGPLDKRSGAPKSKLGPKDSAVSMFTNRLGGSTFVMDDGDEKILRKGPPDSTPMEYSNIERGESGGNVSYPHNEMIRFRTRTGHQILLHNSEDLIYIGNARGTTWIEMTSNGKIDIFAQDSVSVHTAQDVNYTADRDINFTAFQNINMMAGKEIRIEAGDSINKTAGTFIASNAGDSITENAGDSIVNYAVGGITHVASTENMTLLCGSTLNIGAKGEIGIECDGNMKLSTDASLHQIAGSDIFVYAVDTINTHALGNLYVQSDGSIHQKALVNVRMTQDGDLDIKSGGNLTVKAVRIDHNGPTPVEADEATDATSPPIPDPADPIAPIRGARTARVPEHEPWFEHENYDPVAYNPEKTRAGSAQTQTYPGRVFDTFDTRTTPAAAAPVGTSSPPSEFDATQAPREVETENKRAYGGTVTETLPVAGIINGFTQAETDAFILAIGTRESGNSYDAINTLGFVGRFQFGTLALKDTGYIKSTASNNNKAMLDPANWTGKNGITSRAAFLGNPAVQEEAMIEYTNTNVRYLKAKGGITSNDSKAQVAGMLAGAHLLGAGGMTNWRRGKGGRDAYGTTGDEYFKIGSTAVT